MAGSAAALLAGAAEAQSRGWSVEARIGAAVGNYGGAASELELLPGSAWGASVSIEPVQHVSVFAGYSRAAFGCETGFCAGRDVDFASHGMDAGVRLALPVAPAAGPWVSAAVVRRALSVQVDGAEGDDASGWGFSAGAGLELRLNDHLSATPGARYVRHGAGGDDAALVVADVGLRIRM